MAEYIKREDVIKAIELLRPSKKMPDDIVKRAANTAHDFIRTAVEIIPAADVRGNVQGEWVDLFDVRTKVKLDVHGNTTGPCVCSVCGEMLTASDEYPCRGNFCPNCGAEMRGDDNV